MKWLTSFLFLLASPAFGFDRDVAIEDFKDAMTKRLVGGQQESSSPLPEGIRQELLVDVLWEHSEAGIPFTQGGLAFFLEEAQIDDLKLQSKLKLLGALKLTGYLTGLKELLIEDIQVRVKTELTPRSILFVLSNRLLFELLLGKSLVADMLNRFPQTANLFSEAEGEFRVKTDSELRDLLSRNLGSFEQGLGLSFQLFLFCRHDRNYPCRMVLKNEDNEFEMNEKGLWNHPALAASSRGLPYHKTNGYTPSGVYVLDSVMPRANKKSFFGRFRRVKMKFVEASENEVDIKMLLPESARDKNWWKESALARDIGRYALRIHGTGKKNREPDSSFYPHVKTSGCVSQLEGQYGQKKYVDQRHILDQLMSAMKVQAKYENEPRIKGLFYVIEKDNDSSPVTVDEISALIPR